MTCKNLSFEFGFRGAMILVTNGILNIIDQLLLGLLRWSMLPHKNNKLNKNNHIKHFLEHVENI